MSATKPVSAIFELDHDGEATGIVYHYCSPECAEKHPQQRDFDLPKYTTGKCCDYIPETQCASCGKPVDV